MSAAQWIASPSGTVLRGYSQSWAIADLSGNDCSANLIAGVFSDGRGGEEAAERHARLIAAAPEMLEALKSAESLLSGWCERIAEGRSSWDDWDEFYKTAHYGPTKYRPDAGLNERLRAVIAKATTAVELNSVGTPQGVNQK